MMAVRLVWLYLYGFTFYIFKAMLFEALRDMSYCKLRRSCKIISTGQLDDLRTAFIPKGFHRRCFGWIWRYFGMMVGTARENFYKGVTTGMV